MLKKEMTTTKMKRTENGGRTTWKWEQQVDEPNETGVWIASCGLGFHLHQIHPLHHLLRHPRHPHLPHRRHLLPHRHRHRLLRPHRRRPRLRHRSLGFDDSARTGCENHSAENR